jgi:redox-sensitive bicupin YhaK (pirin superfamily)
MTQTIFHPANTRGHANHGWLNAYHTFSFANYFDRERMHFGTLRVLNDDTIAEGMGFGTHPHDNMEIITIPLTGALKHEDSMGNKAVIQSGDVQVMSAGTGIQHSEYNDSEEQEVKLLQIWVFPNKQQVEPRYDQISIRDIEKSNTLYQVLSPNPKDQGVWIHQDAWFHLGTFDQETTETYALKKQGNGVYVFVLEGNIEVHWEEEKQSLQKRDGLGIWDTSSISFTFAPDSRVLFMEVPMNGR